MGAESSKIDFGASKPPSLHDGPNVSKIDGKGDAGRLGIEGTGNVDIIRQVVSGVTYFTSDSFGGILNMLTEKAIELHWRSLSS